MFSTANCQVKYIGHTLTLATCHFCAFKEQQWIIPNSHVSSVKLCLFQGPVQMCLVSLDTMTQKGVLLCILLQYTRPHSAKSFRWVRNVTLGVDSYVHRTKITTTYYNHFGKTKTILAQESKAVGWNRILEYCGHCTTIRVLSELDTKLLEIVALCTLRCCRMTRILQCFWNPDLILTTTTTTRSISSISSPSGASSTSTLKYCGRNPDPPHRLSPHHHPLVSVLHLRIKLLFLLTR